MKLIILGKPSSGKGTQAKLLSKDLNLVHVSTGDLLRNELKLNTPLAQEAEAFMKSGSLVPDSIIIELLKKNLPKDNFILDGFPRTLAQAEELDKITKVNLVVDLFCEDSLIIKRTIARKLCPSCGAIYGLTIPSKVEGVCDKCSSKLYQRADDNEDTIKNRLEVYNRDTFPLIKFYKNKGIYCEVDGALAVSEAQEKIKEKIANIK
jgi:adenylate kinase